jgi:fructose-bisphosphate aldolase class 1
MQALITARALNPEQWADAEKQRLERRAAELDAALTKERQRRAHAAKLRGALSKLDEQCSQASLQSLSKASARLADEVSLCDG